LACRLTPLTLAQRSPAWAAMASASMRSPTRRVRLPARRPVATRPRDRGCVENREQRLILEHGVDLGGIGVRAKAPAYQQALDESCQLARHALDLGVLGRGQRMKAQPAFPIPRVDAIEHERMEMEVEIQGIAEALHERDGAAMRVAAASAQTRSSSQGGEDGAHEEAEHRARKRAVVGHAVAQREGQREHPLPHGDLGQHAVHEVSRGVGHAAAPQAGQKPRPLHEKATSHSRAQASQRTRTKPWARMPHARKARSSRSAKRGTPLSRARA